MYDQLAEEYRQKEAISKAFEGYTKQLKELKQDQALADYLVDALKEICVPAGRIYDKKQDAASPWEQTLKSMHELLAQLAKKDPGKTT